MGISDLGPEARREMIRKKAQELYVKRGGKPGHELDDWLEAEMAVDRTLQEAKVLSQGKPQEMATPSSRTASKVGSGSRRASG